MKKILIALLLLGVAPLHAEEPKKEFEKYQLVLLLKGKNPPALDQAASESLQAAHLAHLTRMATEGKMVVAGPFDGQDDPGKAGLCLYRVGSVQEARTLAESDPKVKAGSLRVEAMEWWTEKGALAFPVADKMTKKK